MKSIELVVVQFDEVKRLIRVGRVPQLRLAHILLDSAVEMIMYRMVQIELAYESYNFDRLENLRRLVRVGRAHDSLPEEIKRLEQLVVSKARRRKIDRDFGAKIDFLVERAKLPEDLGPVLKKLHEYRNETYHRDQHRVEVLRPAVLIYFDAACTVLEHYEPGVIVGSDSVGPELTRLLEEPSCSADRFQVHRQFAGQLREAVGLDLKAVRSALSDHLHGRLIDLKDGLDFLQENLTSNDVLPGDALRMLQLDNDDIEAIFDKDLMRSRPCPITMEDIESWINRATALEDLDDKHALFTEFGVIEDCFEELERDVREAIWRIDEEANMR